MTDFTELFFRKIDNKIKSLEWDINYFSNGSEDPDLWAADIPRLKNIIVGLKVAKQLYEETQKEYNQSIVYRQFLGSINEKLDKLNSIL